MTSLGNALPRPLNRRLDLTKGDNDIDVVGRSRLIHPAAGHVPPASANRTLAAVSTSITRSGEMNFCT